MGLCLSLSLSLEDNQWLLRRREEREEVWVKSWLAVTRQPKAGKRVTSPPDFLQLHNPQPIITHHHPTAAPAVYGNNAIDTTMNYNCAAAIRLGIVGDYTVATT